MAKTEIYLCAFAAVFLITLFFLATAVQNSFNQQSLIATPTIAQAKAVFTSRASTRIKATEDEVFDVITKFDDYTWSSSISNYKFDLQGLPQTGSRGTFRVSLFPFSFRMLISYDLFGIVSRLHSQRLVLSRVRINVSSCSRKGHSPSEHRRKSGGSNLEYHGSQKTSRLSNWAELSNLCRLLSQYI